FNPKRLDTPVFERAEGVGGAENARQSCDVMSLFQRQATEELLPGAGQRAPMITGDYPGGQQILGAPAQWRGKAPNQPVSGFVAAFFFIGPAYVMQQRGHPQDGALLGGGHGSRL